MKYFTLKRCKWLKYGILSCLFLGLVSMTVMASEPGKSIQNNQYQDHKMSLTQEEQQYLSEHPTIIVAADASWRPLEYVKEGQYTGVIAEVITKLEESTGFHVEYKVMDSYAEALAAVQNGEADAISGLADDEAMAEEYSVNLSVPYLTINSAVISKDDAVALYDGKNHKRIAVVTGDYANSDIEARIRNSELIECSSNEECLDKVKREEVDMAIIASYCAEYYMSVPKYSELKSYTISDFGWQLAFGVGKAVDPMMLQIVNRAIQDMAQTDLNEAVYEGLIDAAYDNDLMVFIYKHPLLVIGVILAVVFIIGTLLLTIFLAKKREQRRQLEDATRLRLALERTHLCIWEIDLLTGKIGKINNEHEKHGFYELREGIPESAIEQGYIHPEDIEEVREILNRVRTGEQDVQGCWRIKEKVPGQKTSTYWWEQVLFHVVFDDKNRPVKAIGVSEDVTREKDAQKDSLTSVFTRSSFEQKATHVLNERRNSYLECAYIILDLDGFKGINDTYGHTMGDNVLVSVGAVLRKTFRSTDIVGRLGGDEFTVFMTSISKPEDAVRKGQELVDNVCKLGIEYPFPISCSAGVVVGTKGMEDLPTLYKRADTALYEAKRAGKNQLHLYE